jgi:hypothetical protein
MSLYAAADEERIRAAADVRAWTRSGLLAASQGAAIESSLRTDLRRTNPYLRLALFIFGSIVVWAAIGLSLLLLDTRQDWAIAWVAIIAGAIDLALAGFLVARFRLYRFGIEEALAIWSVVLVAFGTGFLTSIGSHGDVPALVACLTAALASAFAYWLFGYLYAACVAVGALAATPFWVGLPGFAARLFSAVILLGAFLAARRLRRLHGDDFPGDDYGAIEAVAWSGCYAVFNLRLSFDLMPSFLTRHADIQPVFYWATYVAIWLIPAAGLGLGFRDKHRPMIWSGLITALATLLTNKAYLGWEHHTWDPILLGVLLVGVSIVIRRWLAAGADRHRVGFTPQSLVVSGDREGLGMLATLAAAAQPFAARPPAAQAPAFDAGRGGRSGGAGGGTDF